MEIKASGLENMMTDGIFYAKELAKVSMTTEFTSLFFRFFTS